VPLEVDDLDFRQSMNMQKEALRRSISGISNSSLNKVEVEIN
jgi:hypothetical protein